ncbi:hypothetical protein BpHYR1_004517 [Brachionus plicatilis]|uniref:Uncharacterized protein n=1 Tax=Brachionus plicatilis TaxID=10195 RepID=A0A3M7SJH8_BRAPC|nr:hypothetical protein BpHYR1_004517 [Brachionus plicatilis]
MNPDRQVSLQQFIQKLGNFGSKSTLAFLDTEKDLGSLQSTRFNSDRKRPIKNVSGLNCKT